MTYYLKTNTEQEMKEILSGSLPNFIGLDEKGDEIMCLYTEKWAIDWDIPIVAVEAVIDNAGEVVTPPIMEEGFFCNIILVDSSIDASFLNSVRKNPTNPQRIFA